MASIIRIKRSSGTSKPASLQWGEFGYVTGIGSYGGVNQYKDRIFLGDDGTNANPVGGFYYTAMMEHSPGAVDGLQNDNTRNQDRGVVAIMAPATNSALGGVESLKVDQWNVDNIRIDGNTITSTNTDGDINLDPAGIGSVRIPDDTFLNFGADNDSHIEYDEDGTNQLTFTGADVRINIPTQSSDKDTGALIVEGGVGIEKNLNVGGNFTVNGNATFDDIRLEDNIISTVSNDTLYLDPFPDGLSNEGTVVIKGNLQVDGTTTTVNSTTATVNDPILHLGDVTSERTVMETVVSGVSTIRLDSVISIEVGDVVSGNAGLNVGAANTVTSVDSLTKIITLTDATISGISTTTQLTVTHATDTNTDRGLSFAYNTATGISNQVTGFFGFDDSSIASSTTGVENHGNYADDSRRWTYVPDASISNSVVAGTRGFLDVRGVYYSEPGVGFHTGGSVYFDSTGLQRSTNNPATAPNFRTSTQLLTALTKFTLEVNNSVTLSAGDIVRQDGSGAYGVVESAVSGGTVIDLLGVEGTFTSGGNLRREGQNGFISNLSSVPSVSITEIYRNKPHWTATLDGGTF